MEKWLSSGRNLLQTAWVKSIVCTLTVFIQLAIFVRGPQFYTFSPSLWAYLRNLHICKICACAYIRSVSYWQAKKKLAKISQYLHFFIMLLYFRRHWTAGMYIFSAFFFYLPFSYFSFTFSLPIPLLFFILYYQLFAYSSLLFSLANFSAFPCLLFSVNQSLYPVFSPPLTNLCIPVFSHPLTNLYIPAFSPL